MLLLADILQQNEFKSVFFGDLTVRVRRCPVFNFAAFFSNIYSCFEFNTVCSICVGILLDNK